MQTIMTPDEMYGRDWSSPLYDLDVFLHFLTMIKGTNRAEAATLMAQLETTKANSPLRPSMPPPSTTAQFQPLPRRFYLRTTLECTYRTFTNANGCELCEYCVNECERARPHRANSVTGVRIGANSVRIWCDDGANSV